MKKQNRPETLRIKYPSSRLFSLSSEYPMDTLLIFFLNRSFLDIVEKNQKPVFKLESFFSVFRL